MSLFWRLPPVPWAETDSRSSFSGSHPEPQRPQLSPAETQGRGRPPSTWRPHGRCSIPAVSPAPQPGPGLQGLSPTLRAGAESRGPWGSCGPLHWCWQVMCVGTACASRRGQTKEVLLRPAGPGGESVPAHPPFSESPAGLHQHVSRLLSPHHGGQCSQRWGHSW